jgi:hypothetical protein
MKYFSMISPTYLRVALLTASLIAWALTGAAPDDWGP